jgi:hypothetical protein
MKTVENATELEGKDIGIMSVPISYDFPGRLKSFLGFVAAVGGGAMLYFGSGPTEILGYFTLVAGLATHVRGQEIIEENFRESQEEPLNLGYFHQNSW